MNKVIKKIIDFRDARDWKQFHKPKDVAMAISIEASELLENFLWKSENEINEQLKKSKMEVSEEIADVLILTLMLSKDLGLDPIEIVEKKLEKNNKKYPVEKSKGKSTKYTKL